MRLDPSPAAVRWEEVTMLIILLIIIVVLLATGGGYRYNRRGRRT
jgi:hypothetical protein